MAQQTSATLTVALATMYENKVAGLINRACPTLQFLPKIPADGKNVEWAVAYGSADVHASVCLAEDGDISVVNTDTLATAYLPYRVYHDAFGFTGLGEALARVAGNPSDLKNVEMWEMDRSSTRLGAGIAYHMFQGNSAANPAQISGLLTASTGALLSTGIYATVDKGSVTQFAGNHIDASTSSTGGKLSLPLMRQMISTIIAADESSRAPTFISASNKCFDQYCNLFDANRRWVNEVTLGSRAIKLDGGVQIAEFDGIPVVRDVKIPETTTGTMLFLNDQEVRMRYIPQPSATDIVQGNIQVTSDGKTLSKSTGLTGKIIKLGRKGDYDTYAIVCYIQLQVRSPNANGYMDNIALT